MTSEKLEVLRNLISCLDNWKLEKTDFFTGIKTPDWCIEIRKFFTQVILSKVKTCRFMGAWPINQNDYLQRCLTSSGKN